MCVGPSGMAWCAVTENVAGVQMLHLVRYRPGDKSPTDLGVVEVRNPDFTTFTDNDGKPLPFHAGFTKLENGKTITRYVILPYSVLQVRAADISAAGS
jgi:hypothetical protein